MQIWLVENWQYCLIPIIAALIGWITNFIAIKMLFRPRRPRSFLGLKLIGLIPRRQKELARSIGETVERDLISHQDIKDVLQGADVTEEVHRVMEEQLDIFLRDTLGRIPMVGMFMQGGMARELKSHLVQQMQSAVPELMERLMIKVEQRLDFQKIVQEKIESFDLARLEEIIYRISARELKTIEVLGGVLGFLVGLVQVAIMLATGG